MLRQYYKVKQLIDENVRQGEKTELLGADLAQVGKNVELMKTTFTETRKKLKSSIIFPAEEGKKINNPKLILGKKLMEIASTYNEDSLLHSILHKAGESITALASEHSVYEFALEDEIIQEFNVIIDRDLESIEKLKKKLSKIRLELDTARARYVAAQKQNLAKEKLQSIETELNTLSNKFENTQDSFIIELLKFISREKDYSALYIKVLQMEADYHKRCLDILTKSLPEIHQISDTSLFQPVFGISLEKHFEVFHQEINFVLEDCATAIIKNGLKLEGIFRMAGSSLRIKKLKAGFDAGILNLKDESLDLFSLAGVMKQCLRELPEPLLTYQLEDEWIMLQNMNMSAKKEYIISITEKLPHLNYVNLKFLMNFLVQIADNSEFNKMTPSNLAIVIGPNLLWSKNEGKNMICSSVSSIVVECMISNYCEVFKIPEKIHNEASQIHNETSQIHNEISNIHIEALKIHKETSPIQSEASPIPNETSPFQSEVLPIHNETSQSQHDEIISKSNNLRHFPIKPHPPHSRNVDGSANSTARKSLPPIVPRTKKPTSGQSFIKSSEESS